MHARSQNSFFILLSCVALCFLFIFIFVIRDESEVAEKDTKIALFPGESREQPSSKPGGKIKNAGEILAPPQNTRAAVPSGKTLFFEGSLPEDTGKDGEQEEIVPERGEMTEVFPPPSLFFTPRQKEPDSTPMLTGGEVFRILYPDFYIDFLKNIQSALIADGSLSASASVSFTTEAEMSAFLLRVSDILRTKGVFSDVEQKSLEEGIRFVFDAPYERKLLEASALRHNLDPAMQNGASNEIRTSVKDREEFLGRYNVREIIGASEFDKLPAFHGLAPKKEALQTPLPLKSSVVASLQTGAVCPFAESKSRGRALTTPLLAIVRQLYTIFPLLPQADAFCGPTFCINPPECFLPGAPLPGGFNLITPCCFGRICGAPIGCFELCGNGAKPFIRDPVTQICGCG